MRSFMNQSELHPTENSELADLRRQFGRLQQALISALVLVIVISGALNLFLLRQVKYSRTDLALIRPEAENLMAEYTKTGAPALAEIIKQFTAYGRTHSNFRPILIKYKLLKPSETNPAATTGAAPASIIHPATLPKKK
jgi:hypothetical protein